MNHNPADDLFYLGVKVILRNKKNQILLLKFEKEKESFWELPGGRVQIQETEVEAVHRELKEETGIQAITDLKAISIVRSFYRCNISQNKNVGLMFSFFKAFVTNDTVVLSDDHVEYVWVNIEKAEELVQGFYGKMLSELSLKF